MNDEAAHGTLIDAKGESLEEIWAYVEIFGHNRTVGRISERKMGVNIMLQIDVPKGENEFSHSELYSPASIFSIKPTTEKWCRKFAKLASGPYDVLPYIPVERLSAHSEDDPERENEEGEN